MENRPFFDFAFTCHFAPSAETASKRSEKLIFCYQSSVINVSMDLSVFEARIDQDLAVCAGLYPVYRSAYDEDDTSGADDARCTQV